MDSENKRSYQDQLVEYLRSLPRYRRADDTAIDTFVASIESQLTQFLRDNFNLKFDVIYEIKDKSFLEDILNHIDRQGNARTANQQSGGMIKTSLQYYIGFLDYWERNEEKIFKQLHKKDKKRTPRSPEGLSSSTSINDGQQKTPDSQEHSSSPSQPVIPEPQPYEKLEGAKHTDTVTRYERDRSNRTACIAHYGYVCQVCGMNFEQVYGELGKNFIEVHHRYPVSQGERKVNPIEDLVPLCSNCHSMIHRQEDVSDYEGLKAKINKEWKKD